MHHGSCPQEACTLIRFQRGGAWRSLCRGRSLLPSPASISASAGPRSHRDGRIECRFAGASCFARVLQKPPIRIYSSPLSDLSSAATTLEWKPAVDNLLLVLSIALAYVAGIVTPASPSSLMLSKKRDFVAERYEEVRTEQTAVDKEASFLEEEDLWKLARLKLSSSINEADDLEDHIYAEKANQSLQLSLQALAKGPRLRLLLITLEELNKEVWKWQQNESFLRPDWSGFSTQRLCEIVIPICRLWMCGERVRNRKDQSHLEKGCISPDLTEKSIFTKWNSLFDYYSQNYGGHKSTRISLLATGKAEFYADFMYNFCSGSVRESGYCSAETLRNDKTMVLEDLIIFVADRAAALYLDLISTGSIICDSQWFNMLSKSIPSTRSLEKFRNEVALNTWLNDNFQSVTAIFEDRFDLWILKSGYSSSNLKMYHAKVQSTRRRDRKTSKEHVGGIIEQHRMFARRARELRALTGWRYYFSLFLEFSDISGPLLRTALTKLAEGISFLLVTLIGRSLGLIYRGICQSMQWNSG